MHVIAKRILLFSAIFLLVAQQSFSQDSLRKHYTRNVAFTTPVSKNTTINGLAIGVMAEPLGQADVLDINGLNVELGPLGLTFGWAYTLFGTFYAPFNKRDIAGGLTFAIDNPHIFPQAPNGYATHIRGISVSAGGLMDDTHFSGLSLNGILSGPDRVDGLEITGLMNMHYDFKGLMIAGLRNKTTTGTGVQIALINTCKSGRVVQFGLINRIGKRTLPFMNFSFKKQQS